MKIEDPWGISWRVANMLRRFSFKRTLRFFNGFLKNVQYEKPVFIIGAPRSGTTLFFHLLRESEALGGLPTEGHNIWRAFHHPRSMGWISDSVGGGEVRFGERRFVNAYFYANGVYPPRFVEKTPENSLRVAYLLDLFPDAIFLIIRRNPCDVINSLINGWRHGNTFRSYNVPEDLDIPGAAGRRMWRFVLFDGWRDYRKGPIPEIAFQQWKSTILGQAKGRSIVPEKQWMEVYLESFLESPDKVLEKICKHIHIDPTDRLRDEMNKRVKHPVFALSPPGTGKWKNENQAEIKALLPRISGLSHESGYIIDPTSGNFEIIDHDG